MTIGDREGLMARIMQLRGARAAVPRSTERPQDPDPQTDRLQALEARVAYLEQLLQGLQDSVHRESERHGKLIAELEAQIQPEAMGASLEEDKRNRGL